MINHQQKFIFVHIPKTGGSSIELTICPNTSIAGNHTGKLNNTTFDGKHWTYKQINLQTPNINTYFKFTIVRNPYDRIVSLFEWLQTYTQSAPGVYGPIPSDFDTFISLCLESEKIGPANIKSQYEYITNDQNEIELDYIGRFETLDESFKTICNRVGVQATTLIHVNNNNKNKRAHYTKYYTTKTKNMISQLYAQDIDFFGYKFGE